MTWSELSISQWLGLLSGVLGAGVFIWLLVVAGQMDREIHDAILDAARGDDQAKAAEEARYLAGSMRSVHAGIALAGVLFAVALTLFLPEISR